MQEFFFYICGSTEQTSATVSVENTDKSLTLCPLVAEVVVSI